MSEIKDIEKFRKNRQPGRKTGNSRQGGKGGFLPKMRVKLVVFFLLILLAFVLLSVRLIMINRENGDNYKKKILSQQDYVSTVLPYKRGDILDANGTKLAYSEKVYNIVLDSKIMHQSKDALEPTLRAVDQCFDLDMNTIRKFINENKDNQYYVVAKRQSYDTIAPFLELQSDPKNNIKGVWFEEEYKRIYPYGSLACDVLGFTVADNTGAFGLEEFYNSTLNGTNGREYGYLTEDSTLERTTISAEDGKTIVTSIDANVQAVVEKYVAQWNHEHEGENAYRTGELGSKNTGVIVMNPKNGEVIAMAGYPVFDLNNPRTLSENGLYSSEQIQAMTDDEKYEALNEIWRNFCISDTYEPGSVAKSLTISAGLDCGALKGDETFFCSGVKKVGGHDIHCHKRIGHGTLTVSGALEQSCNVALMDIGDIIGKKNLTTYFYNFNMGLKTNVDLAGEARTDTLVFDPEKMVSSDLAISTFGQGYNLTMIQLATAFCSVVNGGYYYRPHVVKEIQNADGATIEKINSRVLKQTISETTSKRMREYLTNVCQIGTGTTAVPAGYIIGGKTGTAEMYPRKRGNYVVSFAGFAPVDDPEVVIYVVVDRPNVPDQPHSTFAQEICKNILTEILPYLQIFRTEELSDEQKQELQDLGVLPNGEINALDEYENTAEEPDPEETEDEIVPQVDPDTGYVIDPNTGEFLDPDTYAPIDENSSDLGGVGALVDDTVGVSGYIKENSDQMSGDDRYKQTGSGQ